LARALDLSLPTITSVVKHLLDDGVVVEAEYKQSTGGRRAALLRLNADFAHAIGLEVSCSYLRAARVNLVGEVVDREGPFGPLGTRSEGGGSVRGKSSSGGGSTQKETESSRPARTPADGRAREPELEQVVGVARALLARSPVGLVRGVGVGISGLVSAEAGLSVKFPRSEKWVEVPLGRILSDRLRVPAWVANDVQAATLGELGYGEGREVESFVYLHLGEGIALGLVVRGTLYQGAHGNVGELGHSIVQAGGPICYCGNYGCLESLASPAAIVRQSREAITGAGVESRVLALAGGDLANISVEHVLQAAEAGDRLASNLVEKAAGYIGLSVANLVNVLSPERLILAGAMVERGGPLLEAVTRNFRSLVMPGLRNVTELRQSQLGGEACVLGAAALVFDSLIDSYPVPPRREYPPARGPSAS
jgi:predicted NBD/HSP70 family sugar kinase